MTEEEYFDDDYTIINSKSIEKENKECYKDFMDTLEMVAGMVSAFPYEWQLQMLLGIMKDI